MNIPFNKASKAKDGLLGLPIQGTDLMCALGLHAVVLFCAFGLQPKVQPRAEGHVLMAQWISAEAPAEDATSVQAPQEIKRMVEKPMVEKPMNQPAQTMPSKSTADIKPAPAPVPKTNVMPPQASVLTADRSDPSEATSDRKVETRPENSLDTGRDEVKPMQAAYTPPTNRAGKADATAAGGRPAPMSSMNPDYLAELFRKLARHKVYPSELKKNKIEGRVVVKFTLAADGRVMSSSIQQSSGSDSLDDAALQMLNKASPLPAIPSYMNRSEMTLAVPVEYSLLTDR
ncbi:MAG: TonB family protein [Limnobacter sp.]|nr:TonB family protein [Limnobacter sp.]